MNVDEKKLSRHFQFCHGSCIPSTIEAVMKLEDIIKEDDFRFQTIGDYWKKDHWIPGLSVNNDMGKQIVFKTHFLEDRGKAWLDKNEEAFFNLIDSELADGKLVIIIMNVDDTMRNFHPEIIYEKVGDKKYKTFTFHAFSDRPGDRIIEHYTQDLNDRVVSKMNGTALYTYKVIQETAGRDRK